MLRMAAQYLLGLFSKASETSRASFRHKTSRSLMGPFENRTAFQDLSVKGKPHYYSKRFSRNKAIAYVTDTL